MLQLGAQTLGRESCFSIFLLATFSFIVLNHTPRSFHACASFFLGIVSVFIAGYVLAFAIIYALKLSLLVCLLTQLPCVDTTETKNRKLLQEPFPSHILYLEIMMFLDYKEAMTVN